jgi:hypothetical protein
MTALLLGLGVVVLVGRGGAADDKKVPEAVTSGLQKAADDLEKNSKADVSKDLEAVKKFDLKLPMRLFKKRENGGWGVGKADDKIDPDGIEKQLEKLGDGAKPDALAKNADAYKQMAFRTAAIAALLEAKAPTKAEGKKQPKDWIKWSAELKTASVQLADAIKAKDAAAVTKAAAAASKTCSTCHDVFRDDE